jgi:hypothetical protein
MTTLSQTRPGIMAEVERWLAEAQAICDRGFTSAGPHFPGDKKLTVMQGPRYLRIVAGRPSGRYVFGFIDLTNGDVLKAHGWKGPAQKARGNLYDAQGGLGPVRWSGVR